MGNGFNIGGCLRPWIMAGGLLWFCMQPLGARACPELAGEDVPDSAAVTVILPHLTVPADTDTVVVPIGLRNEWDEVGGLQVDLSLRDLGPALDTIRTTPRTSGWRIDMVGLTQAGATRILLFDPAGSNVAAGAGPVMELVFTLPEGTDFPDFIPLTVAAVIVSDPVGGVLPAQGEDGSLTLGELVELAVGRVRADQGERVSLTIDLSNTGTVAGIQFGLSWEPDLLELVDVTTTSRTARFQLEWNPPLALGVPASESPGRADSLPVGGGVWLYTQAGKELEPGVGDILKVTFAVRDSAYSTDIDVYLDDALVMEGWGRERAISRITPGRITVFPGYLDPPRGLVALSGQDGRVSLSWAPPTGGGVGREAILLVDDDASQLGPPYMDVGGQMANDLAIAGYAYDYFTVPAGADGPGQEVLQRAHTVIWMTGYEWGYHPTLTPNDQANLAAFLKQGGRVWLIGQDIIWDIGDSFINRYFGVQVVAEDAGSPEALTGCERSLMAGTEYPATAPDSEVDYGDAITASHGKARGLVDGLTHYGAVGQSHTAFWALEYGFILGRMDRIDGVQRQLAAFGVKYAHKPGIGRVLTGEQPSVYATRGPSPLKTEAMTQGFTPLVDSLTLIPALVPQVRKQAPPLTGYTVYRSEEMPVARRAETQLATVGADKLAFVDTAVVKGQTYGYAVTAIYDGRFESGPTNDVAATPASWVDFAVGQAEVMAGDRAAIPIRIKNDAPVAGIHLEIRDSPAGILSNPQVILGQHVPPDWVVSLDRDTLSGSLSVVGFSPRVTTIPPGEGDVLLLLMDADAETPAKVNLEAGKVVISDAHGVAYHTHVTGGSVSVDVQLARLRVGTGAPTHPGDTGYVSIFMDNPRPVMAFQLVVKAASDDLQVVAISGASRLPADAHIAHSQLEKGAVRLIESSFSNTPIAAGRGPVASITYRVSPDAPEGLVGLNLVEVVLSDERGHTLRQTTVSGSFPVGEVRGVFAPATAEGEPGHTVTIPVGLTNSVELCAFRMTFGFDPRFLTFLSSEALERLPRDNGLTIQPEDPGQMLLHYATDNDKPIQAGTGPVLDLILLLDRRVPRDTSFSITLSPVSASGCEERLVFALGQEGEVTVGKPLPQPVHLVPDVAPTGITHFIQVRAATLGGAYLGAGDELAVIDSAGWINPEGEVGILVAGAGVVQTDGSVNITAVMGFEPGSGVSVLSGARTGGPIHFLAWNRETDREGRTSTDARYVLGEGLWGENNGLTIVELVRIPEKVVPAPGSIPEQLEVDPNDPNPFDAATMIRFGLPGEMEVKVTIYNLLGREVITLHDGLTAAGFHEVVWDGSDAAGSKVTNGMYFYQVRTPGGTVTRKMLLMR